MQRIPGILLMVGLLVTSALCSAGHAKPSDFAGTWKGTMVSRANPANQYTFVLRISMDKQISGRFRVTNPRVNKEALEIMRGQVIGENRLRLIGVRFEYAPAGWFLDDLDLTIEHGELHGVYREKEHSPIRGDLRGHR